MGVFPHPARRVLGAVARTRRGAQDNGAFADQIVPVFATETTRVVTPTRACGGEPPWRNWPGSSRRSSRRVIHAGNSSQISDGAAALLVRPQQTAVELGLTPLVRYRAGAVTGADPVLMLTGPIPATEKVLTKAASRWPTSACSR